MKQAKSYLMQPEIAPEASRITPAHRPWPSALAGMTLRCLPCLAFLALFGLVRVNAQVDAPPVLAATSPPFEATVTELNFIEVIFSENVTNVDAGDLLINGSPITTNLVAVEPRDYIFRFPQPPTGTVTVAFAPSHGITDLAGQAFVGTNSWTYTFDPGAIPPVLAISEFMADNEQARSALFPNGIEDEDGSRSDWIEIFNRGTIEVNLAGWFLTDNPTNLTKWRFPETTLAANRYLLVWASEKDRTNPAALHTNFRLERNGEYLALVDPQTNIVSEFAPTNQFSDISYGRDTVDPSLVGYFITPTPRAQNAASGSGFAPSPVFSLESGIYTNNTLTLVLSSPAGTNGTIRYTVNGAEPTNNSPIYTNALSIIAGAVVKARVYQPGLWPSPIVARTYNLLDNTTRDFTSNLPILIINPTANSTAGRTVPADVVPGGPRLRASFTVITPGDGRSSLRSTPEFQGPAGTEVFGQTSAGFPKRPYNIEILDEFGNDKAVSILGMPAEADWKLRNPYTDKCLMNDFLAYELFEQMGNYSVRRRFVEVFVDETGGKLTYPADYRGVFVFLEKIEVDNNRVDIAELTPQHTNEPAISGGYMFKKDKDSGGDRNFSTAGGGGYAGQALKVHEPKPREITTPQVNWLTAYLNRFEQSMYATNWLTRTGTNHYSHYIDIDTFVDQHWIVEFPKQIDGYRLSGFYSKDRNGKVKPVPIWDWNLSFGNADYLEGGRTNGWYYALLGTPEHIWLRRLISGSASATTTTGGDPDFNQKIVDRWAVLRTNICNGPRVLARIDELAAQLSEAAARDFAKFPRLGTYIWPNPNGAPNWHVDFVNPRSYQGIIDEMKKWVLGRYAWIDSQFVTAPAFNRSGGQITPGFNLAITAPGGTIYYTVDGTDPRLPGGSLSPRARTYTSVTSLTNNVRIFARARGGTAWNGANAWSGPTVATFVITTPTLAITEIMYHPRDVDPGSTNSESDFEYIELKNIGPVALNLQGVHFTNGIEFSFTGGAISNLAPGQYVLLVKNRAAFTSRYGAASNIAGEFTGALDNAGERLTLIGALEEPILDFEYQDSWFALSDGSGFSLVLANENEPFLTYGRHEAWRLSSAAGGSAGRTDPAAPQFGVVIINEIITHSLTNTSTDLDAIELYNTASNSVNIGSWFLSDSFSALKKFQVPAGTIIPPGGYLVFYETNFNRIPGGSNSFLIDGQGDDLFLVSASIAGELTGYLETVDFGAAEEGVSFGRHQTSTGESHFVAQSTVTLGTSNAPPRVGPIVITEIMYNPPATVPGTNVVDNTQDEYIELHNITDQAVVLAHAAHPTNTWQLDDAVELSFPTNVVIPPHGFALAVSFDPQTDAAALSAFRGRYGLAPTTLIFGPYSGKLDNSGDSVELRKPDAPIPVPLPGAGSIPRILVDRVTYADVSPWSAAADGIGPSLQRRDPARYGNDPANWSAALPTPAALSVPGTAPTVGASPATQTVIEGTSATLVGSATGSGLRYQWRLNGANVVGGTNLNLILSSARPQDAGTYNLVAFNSGGATVSSNVVLNVRGLPIILTQPASRSYGPGSNVVVSVTATGTGILRYQWQFNGADMAGETNSTISLRNISLAQDGIYSVRVTDDVGTTLSAPAFIVVLVLPTITRQPIPQTVVERGTVTFNVGATGRKPLSYRWRLGSLFLPYPSLPRLTLTNVQLTNAGNYSVFITNIAGSRLSSQVALTVLRDTDADGLPDDYETAHGLDPNVPVDGGLDPDRDGMDNFREFLNGTDHLVFEILLKPEPLQETDGKSVFEFYIGPDRGYTVQYKDGLTNQPWQRLMDLPATPTSRLIRITNSVSPPAGRFYRAVTPIQP